MKSKGEICNLGGKKQKGVWSGFWLKEVLEKKKIKKSKKEKREKRFSFFFFLFF